MQGDAASPVSSVSWICDTAVFFIRNHHNLTVCRKVSCLLRKTPDGLVKEEVDLYNLYSTLDRLAE